MSTSVIIGGGPAGMMAAVEASKKSNVILLEGNEKLGKKLFITGKGRCNITNAKEISEFFNYIPGNPQFLYSALYTFTNQNTIEFFEKLGVHLKVERGDRVFPESDKSSDILGGFIRKLRECRVDIRLNSRVKEILFHEKHITAVKLENDEIIKGDNFIICTGGKSYPLTGSKGDGFIFANELGHKIIDLKPSLVPIEIKEDWIKELQGLSLKNVQLSILKNGKSLYSEFGEMLFTHFGVSGPIVLSASRIVNSQKDLLVSIDLKPALNDTELDKRIQKDFQLFKNKDLKNSLSNLLPQKIINRVILMSGIAEDKKVHSITKTERQSLVHTIKNFIITIKGLRPIEEAIVTAGGVATKEIDPSTMKSKIVDNLYFAGEVIDVDAFTGGYNIQVAISTGFLAGKSICDK